MDPLLQYDVDSDDGRQLTVLFRHVCVCARVDLPPRVAVPYVPSHGM